MKTVCIFLVVAVLIAGMVGCNGSQFPPSEDLEIRDWYDLNAIRDNLDGDYILMNDLDSTTVGYKELAGPTAGGGKGWQPIGYWNSGGYWDDQQEVREMFEGNFNGQGYEIRDLFIDRPDEDYVGLFCRVDEGGCIENIGVMNVDVTGYGGVGGLAGVIDGTVSNSFWDIETSGQATSDGGTGKNTTEMQDIATFSGVGWSIIAVANPGIRNPSYTWNIVDDKTYSFLSWES